MKLLHLTNFYYPVREIAINPENISSLYQHCTEFETRLHTVVTMKTGEVFFVTENPLEIDYNIFNTDKE